MPYDDTAAARVRRILAKRRDVVERKMMGGLCFMVKGSMCCGVSGSAVMVRVGAEAYRQMLAEPHVRPLEFAGRRPRGFVLVEPEAYRTDTMLGTWVQRGIDFVTALPPKRAAAKSRRRSA
jgi:TfoX/Sxy family transcriptional regulator of competence genes